MEDMALELEEQRHHDAKMARLAKEKDIRDTMMAALEESLDALTRWSLVYGDSELCTEAQAALVSHLKAAIAKGKTR